MATIDVLMAKKTLSKLIESIETGTQQEVIISRHGHPVARLVPIHRQPVRRRVGVARGEFDVRPDADFDARVARTFLAAKR